MLPKAAGKAGPLGSFFIRWPEVAWPLAIWTFVLSVSWLRAPAYGKPYEWTTLGAIIGCLLCINLPILLIGKPLGSAVAGRAKGASATQPPMATKYAIMAFAMLCFVAAVSLYLLARRGYLGLDIEEVRGLKSEMEIDSTKARLYNLFAPFGLLSGFWLARWSWPGWVKYALIALFLGLVGLTYKLTGARFEVIAPIAIMGATILVLRGWWIVNNFRRALLIGGGALLFGLLANTALNVMGLRGGMASANVRHMVARTSEFARTVGLPNLPDEALISIALFDEYTLMPLSYFDFYLNENDLPAAGGGLQFPLIARRLGFEDGLVIKETVDSLYGGLDITINVWATGIREMCIDFGPIGMYVAFLFFGSVTGVAKRFSNSSVGAQFLLCVLTAYFLFLPFVSLFKGTMMQVGFYASLLWMPASIFAGKRYAILTSEPAVRGTLVPANT